MRSLMLVAGVLLAGAATIAHAATVPAAVARSPASGLPLNGARLGMTLETWRGLPWMGSMSQHVAPDCTRARGAKGASGALRPVSADRVVLDCRYVAHYGAYTLAEPLPLSGDFQLREPLFEFVDGRLTEIRAYSSIDAFNLLMTRLQKAYGAPLKIARDQERFGRDESLPRVRATWRTPAGFLVLTDPSADPQQLEISIRAAPPSVRRVG